MRLLGEEPGDVRAQDAAPGAEPDGHGQPAATVPPRVVPLGRRRDLVPLDLEQVTFAPRGLLAVGALAECAPARGRVRHQQVRIRLACRDEAAATEVALARHRGRRRVGEMGEIDGWSAGCGHDADSTTLSSEDSVDSKTKIPFTL